MKRTASALAASLSFALALAGASAAPAQKEEPRVLSAVVPLSPPDVSAARIVGKVEVEVEIDGEGRVASVEVHKGPPMLRYVSLDAARLWRFAPSLFNTRQSLTFDFRAEDVPKEEREAASPFHVFVVYPRRSDTVSYIPSDHEGRTCEVHGFKLEKDKVEIAYGLMLIGPDEYEAEKSFPHANRRVGGGCVVTDESPKYAEVLYCRACRAAEDDWRQKRKARRLIN